jgi:hypothetical protein
MRWPFTDVSVNTRDVFLRVPIRTVLVGSPETFKDAGAGAGKETLKIVPQLVVQEPILSGPPLTP